MGIGQLLHEPSGAARMVEMDVRQEHEIDIAGIEILLVQCVHQ